MTGSNWTGRTPRTLWQAFGTYTRPHISEPRQPQSIASVLLAVALGIFAVCFIVHYAMKGY